MYIAPKTTYCRINTTEKQIRVGTANGQLATSIATSTLPIPQLNADLLGFYGLLLCIFFPFFHLGSKLISIGVGVCLLSTLEEYISLVVIAL